MADEASTHLILERWRGALGATGCSLALLDEAGRELTFTAIAGAGAAVVGTTISVRSGIAGYVLRTGEPLVIDDLLNDARFLHQVAAEARYVPSSMMASRIESGGVVYGVVEVLDPDLSGSHSRRIRLLGEFVSELAIALDSSDR